MNQMIKEALPALQELKTQGKIRYTGISGLPLSIFKKVLKAHPVDAILSYCHYSLNDDSLTELLPELAEAGTGLVNASPLSMGLLTGNPVPAWHPATSPIREACRRAFEFCEAQGYSLPKLAIQFSVSHPGIPTTLVSTANAENIRRNAAFALEEPDMDIIGKVMEILKPVQRLSWHSGRPEHNEEVRIV
ncbi:D-threo-aldose 1-dehydrogenase [compost metagenome]